MRPGECTYDTSMTVNFEYKEFIAEVHKDFANVHIHNPSLSGITIQYMYM